jgi:hypothetical protein
LAPALSCLRRKDVPGDVPGHPASRMRLSPSRPRIVSIISVVVRLPVCPIPGAEVNRARQAVGARPLSARPGGHPNCRSPAPVVAAAWIGCGETRGLPVQYRRRVAFSPSSPRPFLYFGESICATRLDRAAFIFDDTTLANNEEWLCWGTPKLPYVHPKDAT